MMLYVVEVGLGPGHPAFCKVIPPKGTNPRCYPDIPFVLGTSLIFCKGGLWGLKRGDL